jgi:CHAT domain-containing protein/tetratricopeptide (TPR) repeat protein
MKCSIRLLAFALILLGFGCGEGTPEVPSESRGGLSSAPRSLAPGEVMEGSLGVGESCEFTVVLEAERLIQVVVDARWDDLTVTLEDPLGNRVLEEEVPSDRWGKEEFLVRTRRGGEYRLRLRSADTAHREGTFILVLTHRGLEPEDGRRLEAQTLYRRALDLADQDEDEDREAALTLLEREREIRRGLEDGPGEANSLYRQGLLLKDLKRFESGAECLRQARERWHALGEVWGEAETLYRLGALYRLWGRAADADAAFRAALPLWRRSGDVRGEALTLYNQAFLHHLQADLQSALGSYSEALALFRALGEREMEARTMNSRAAVLQRLGESDRALDAFEEVARIYESLVDREGQASALNNIGWIHLHVQQDPAAAIPYIERAVRLVSGDQNARSRATFLGNLSRAHLDLGETEAALRRGREALALSEAMKHPFGVASRHRDLGLIQLRMGALPLATEHFGSALRLSRQLGDRTLEAEALYGMALVRRREGALEAALERVQEALTILEAVRTDVDSRSLQSTFTAFQRPVYEEEVALRVALARRFPDRHAVGAALEASERARARGLLEILSEVGVDLADDADPALLEEEQALRRRLNTLELERWHEAGEAPAALAGEIREVLNALALLDGRIRRASSPRYAELTRPRPLSVAAIQGDLLEPDSLLLEYSLGAEKSFLFAVTTEGLAVYDLPPAAEIETLTRRVQSLLADTLRWRGSGWRGQQREFLALAGRLAEQLLGPVAAQLSAGGPARLLIAGDGALLELPFAALPLPSGAAGAAGAAGATGAPGDGYRPLVEAYEIVHLPSASSVAVLRQQLAGRKPAEHTLAVLADPVFEPWDERLLALSAPEPIPESIPEPIPDPVADSIAELAPVAVPGSLRQGTGTALPRLPQSRVEAQRIAALLPSEESFVALGLDASRATALDPRLRHYRILHFATHGVLNSRTPELSGLVLSLRDAEGRSRDGFLRLHDIYALDLNAELVVLSACQTARGKNLRGEGIVSLVRGFLYAGARGVLASQWQTDDQATALLMERFYRQLLTQGQPPATALRQAQLAMLRGELGNQWTSPNYWSAFVLQGEWRPLPLRGQD